MQPVMAYLLKMMLCSGILLGYYCLALRNERFHRWNRFYLLGSMLLSISVPLLNIPLMAPAEPSTVVYFVSELPWNKVSKATSFEWSWKYIITITAILVSVALFLRLMASVIKVIRLYRSQPATRLHDVSLLLTEEASAPFSFFKWLFWRKDIDPDTDNGKRMLQHELTHINEKHSADKLFTELLMVVFWINPLFWIMRRELYAIHEFLADQKAIAGNDGPAFAAMILLASHTTVSPSLSNPFFNSQLKRRLLMITTSTSNSHSYMRRISGLMLMLLTTTLLVLNIQQAQAQKKNTPPPPPPPVAPPEGQWKELPDSIKSAEVIDRNGVCYIRYEMKDGRKFIYELNQAKKKNYFIPPPPPPPPAPGAPHAAPAKAPGAPAPAPVKTGDTPEAAEPPIAPAIPAPAKAAGSPAPMATPAIPSTPSPASAPSPPAKKQNLFVDVMGDKPVYIYSGKQITEAQMKAIDPNTIESVDVLKGDEAVKVFGEAGKNGAVSITPKNQNYTLDMQVDGQTFNVRTTQVSTVHSVNSNAVNTVNINSNISIAPLYVVNNQKVSVETVNKIQAAAIVSVNVLKDQDAVKQYGKEGKNGVVEITTNKNANIKH